MQTIVKAAGLGKTFNRRVIFSDISFSVNTGETLRVSGRNGSGKSTLLKIIAHVLTPTSGEVSIIHGSGRDSVHSHIGFVSPYLNLYDEFTATENLLFGLSIRGMRSRSGAVGPLLARVGLGQFVNTPARVFSSGMKQRLKYAFALSHEPPVMILDEPMSNLDTEGKGVVADIMAEQKRRGLLIVATNDLSDVSEFDQEVNLNG